MKIEVGKKITSFSVRSTGLSLLALVLAATFAIPAFAFQFESGDLTGSLDSTLSYGLAWRVSDRDSELIGTANGGSAYSLNGDDGNLNYDRGDLINNTAKVTSEMALQYKMFGLFARGTAFYDFENNDADRARTELSDDALDLVGKDAELLDAYITADFDLATMPSQVRVGSQVLSWGESTFIQNGINVINPFDVSKLRVAGAELKEGLIPVGMISASISPTDNITFEGFYQYDWENVEIDPVGSYWNTNDSGGVGGDKVMLGFGRISDLGSSWSAGALADGAFAGLQGAGLIDSTEVRNTDPRFNMVPRGANVYADNDGQYGVAMRVYAPGLNDTEFGFYYMNYHSRMPVVSSKTGTAEGVMRTGVAKAAAVSFATAAAGFPNPATDPGGYAAAVQAAIIAADAAADIPVGGGYNASDVLTVEEVANIGAGAVYAAMADPTGVLAEDYIKNEYVQTAEYFLEYPEDIQLFGMSFNTVLPISGIALQGEISYRRDVPLQVDDLEILFATLGPISPTPPDLYGASNLNQLADVQDPAQFSSPYEQVIHGYKRLDMSQIQMTATKLFGPTFGADQFVMVGEVGLTHVYGMPSKDELRFEGAGTPISGNAALSGSHYGEIEPASAFADENSWGYRVVAKFDINNAIGAVTLSPRVAWAHDVDGNSPGPGGNFIEDRKAVTLGLGANYQNQWTADLSYTDYFGAGRYNLVNDRDFVAFNIKYSF